MATKKTQFAEIMAQDWYIPPQNKPLTPITEPVDSLNLSLQAAKHLPPVSEKSQISKASDIILDVDTQGNQTKLSTHAKNLATNVQTVWETKL